MLKGDSELHLKISAALDHFWELPEVIEHLKASADADKFESFEIRIQKKTRPLNIDEPNGATKDKLEITIQVNKNGYRKEYPL